MTALAQGTAGLALVMCFALLRTRLVSAATILLVVQSGAVAVTAVVVRHPIMAIAPAALGTGIWLIRHQTPMLEPSTAPIGGTRLGVAVGAVLAILCQSQGGFALPLAIVLLAILLAATRSHPMMQIIALVVMANGSALAGCLVAQAVSLTAALLVPIACLALPLPLASGLLVPAVMSSASRDRSQPWVVGLARLATLPGWADLGLAVVIFAATLLVPLDPLALVFAPLLALDGVVRSCVRHGRRTLTPMRRGVALAQTGLAVLAVCTPDPLLAWVEVLAAIAATVLPRLARHWNSLVLAYVGAGLALFGMLVLAATPTVLGYFSLFAGFAAIAAAVPDLAVVLAVLILRLATGASWQPSGAVAGTCVAVMGLLACAMLLTGCARLHRVSLMQLGQASIAVVAISDGQAEGRFAGLVLLILLILCRAAARATVGPAAALAIAGLGGVPPLGVFPGLILVVLALTAHDPWILPVLGAALIPILAVAVPRRVTDPAPRPAVGAIAWLPLVLAVVVGYFAPEGLVHWWRILAVGRR